LKRKRNAKNIGDDSVTWYPGKNLGRFLVKNDKAEKREQLPQWFPDWLFEELSEKQIDEYRDLIYWSAVLRLEDLQKIPEIAYHVSPEPYKILSEGFRTGKELGKQSFGGHGSYISVTTYENAKEYQESIRIATRILNNTITFAELKDWIVRTCGARVFEMLYSEAKRNIPKSENSSEFQWEMFHKLAIYSDLDAKTCRVLYMGKPTALIGKTPQDIKIVEVKPSPELRFRHEYNIFHDESMAPYYTYNKHEAEWRIWDPAKAIPMRVLETSTHPKYRLYENNDVLLETENKEEAMSKWRDSHRKSPDKFHEVHEWWDGKYHGICQFAPGDKVRW